MEEFGTALIVAVGGAALLAALAFRQLIDTVIKLNDELQEVIVDRQESEVKRENLKYQVADMGTQIALLKSQLEAQALEIQELRGQLKERDAIIRSLQSRENINPN